MSDAIGRAVTLASMDALARFAQPWLDRAARIGADPRDDDEQRLRKALLVLVCVLILPIPLGNMLPAAAAAVLALSLVQRDGLLALAGYALSLTSAGVLVIAFRIILAALRQTLSFLTNA
jgi:hypothetical protein